MSRIIYSNRFEGKLKAQKLDLKVNYNFKCLAKKTTPVIFDYYFEYDEKDYEMKAGVTNHKDLEFLFIKKVFNDKKNKKLRIYIRNFGDNVILIKKDQVFGYLYFESLNTNMFNKH